MDRSNARCGADLSAMGAFDVVSLGMSLLVLAAGGPKPAPCKVLTSVGTVLELLESFA